MPRGEAHRYLLMIELRGLEYPDNFLADQSLSSGAAGQTPQEAQSQGTTTVGNSIIRYDVGVEAIRSCHVRAARALLDWSMLVLAESSGVSLSTVKRLEEKIAPHAPRSLTKILTTLCQAGIYFVMMNDGTLAVAKRDIPIEQS
jgi:hypothetical protein